MAAGVAALMTGALLEMVEGTMGFVSSNTKVLRSLESVTPAGRGDVQPVRARAARPVRERIDLFVFIFV